MTLASPMTSTTHTEVQRDGYALLRGVIPTDWLDSLRTAFDRGVIPVDQWPVRRGHDWRHSLLDLDPTIQAMCRLPLLLATVGELVGETFFLSQVEGREPLQDGGHQGLHRDLSAQRPGDTVVALAFFDDYGPDNGATRLVPSSHRPADAPFGTIDDERAEQIAGHAGDILVFDADLLHAACLNKTGARRRSALFTYFAAPLYETHLRTAKLRSVRMDTSDRFDRFGRVA